MAPNEEVNKVFAEMARRERYFRWKRIALQVTEGIIGTAGFLLLAEAAGWKLSLAFFLITWAANIHARLNLR